MKRVLGKYCHAYDDDGKFLWEGEVLKFGWDCLVVLYWPVTEIAGIVRIFPVHATSTWRFYTTRAKASDAIVLVYEAKDNEKRRGKRT